jgi:hypothetical protein
MHYRDGARQRGHAGTSMVDTGYSTLESRGDGRELRRHRQPAEFQAECQCNSAQVIAVLRACYTVCLEN